MQYKILSHTADLRLEIYGETVEALFINAAQAIADILAPKFKKGIHFVDFKDIIKIQSLDRNSLLVDFLNEILTRSNINKCVYRVVRLIFDGNSLEAEINGIKVDKFDEDIKAVTYHEVNIREKTAKQKPPIFYTTLVLDI